MSQRHYKVSARRWFTLDAVELEYDGTKATFNGSRNVYAPAEYSYRCELVTSFRWPLLVPRSSKDPANQWRVSFEDFQVTVIFFPADSAQHKMTCVLSLAGLYFLHSVETN